MSCLHKLKTEIASLGSPFEFRRNNCSLNDFLRNVIEDDDDEYVIAAKVIDYFCVDAGVFNRFTLGIKLCVGFMGNCHPIAESDQRSAIIALGKIMNSDPTLEAVTRWAKSHYG